jgi:predicted Fe-Mo cluster-binding NifX family protein
MRVAISLWNGRISPIFDESNRILLVDISNKQEKRRGEELLLVHNPFERAKLLLKLGVDLLICGMISQAQQTAIASTGIRIIPHICGAMEEVIAAFLDGRIENGALRMPGCGAPKRLSNRRHAQIKGDSINIVRETGAIRMLPFPSGANDDYL